MPGGFEDFSILAINIPCCMNTRFWIPRTYCFKMKGSGIVACASGQGLGLSCLGSGIRVTPAYIALTSAISNAKFKKAIVASSKPFMRPDTFSTVNYDDPSLVAT